MSLFSAAFAKARGALDATFGERVRVTPVAGGEFTRGAAGASYDARAIVDMPEEIWRPAGVADGGKGELIVTQPQAEFPLDQFAAGAPQIAEGFEIELVERPGAPRWRVLTARVDGVSAIVCALGKIA